MHIYLVSEEIRVPYLIQWSKKLRIKEILACMHSNFILLFAHNLETIVLQKMNYVLFCLSFFLGEMDIL